MDTFCLRSYASPGECAANNAANYKLTNVSAINSFSGRLETETNILVPPPLLGHNLLAN
jgi:hypothetical protein